MKILVIGGTRFFGIPMVEALLDAGHEVTIATRQTAGDNFGERVLRLTLDRESPESLHRALAGKHFDTVIDKIAYSSEDVKNLLEVIDCHRLIHMSTTAVYRNSHFEITEEEFDGNTEILRMCKRSDYNYSEVKRQAECALWQLAGPKQKVAVRYPYVIGKNDYTKRLLFYVEKTIKGIPMMIDNPDSQMSFVGEEEAGHFLAFLADNEFCGPINGACGGTISPAQIIRYVEERTGKKAVLRENGEAAPYNGEADYSISTARAETIGFHFSKIHAWIYRLLDYYIDSVNQ